MAALTLRDAVVPLRTVDADGGDDADLAAVLDVVGDARVVLLGESAHWASEAARLRDRLLRFLVTSAGFTTFALESGLPEGLLVDDWVRGGPGRLADVARDGVGYAAGRCRELHAQLDWMREHHRTARTPVGFRGLDVPGGCADPGPGVAACLRRLPPRPGDADLLAAASFGPAPAPEGGAAVPAGLAARLDVLVERAADAGDDLARRCARGARTVVEVLEHGLYPGPGRNLRNEVMADELRAVLADDPRTRVLVGAHDVHVLRSPSFDGTAPIGMLLADELGDDLVVIGQTRGHVGVPGVDPEADAARRYPAPAGPPRPAPPATLDARLDALGPGPSLVDLRAVDPAALDGVTALQGAYGVDVAIEPRRALDAVVHIRTTTPVAGVDD